MSDLNSVLIVDDDKRVLDLLRLAVLEEGCEVAAFEDPRAALEDSSSGSSRSSSRTRTWVR